MELSQEERQLRDRFFTAMLEAVFPLKAQGPDPEETLELLIQTAEMLKEHFEQELEELRVEQVE